MDVYENKTEEERLQWHPALYAGIQIEFEDEAEDLIFENEHQLGTKPMEIDVLIIKNEAEKSIRKNIGRIFRKYNIIEYKSPTDYLCIDDFYKVCAYACLYKADAKYVDEIQINELTITFISESYPEKMVQHIKDELGFTVLNIELGIYYIFGAKIPIQMIVQKELSAKENLWLRSLTDKLSTREETASLIDSYQRNKKNKLYDSAMDMIMRANRELFKEDGNMTSTMIEWAHEVLADEYAKMSSELAQKNSEFMQRENELAQRDSELAQRDSELAQRDSELAQRDSELTKKDRELTRKETEIRRVGEQKLSGLFLKLTELGRNEDIMKALKNPEYREQMYEEFEL